MPPHHFRRLMLWALGRALPEASLLVPFMRVGLLGLTAAIAGGILFTFACMGLLAAFYIYLHDQQALTPLQAMLAVTGTAFVAAIGILIGAQKIFRQRLEPLNGAGQNPPHPLGLDDSLLEIPGMLVNSFLEGVLGGSSSTRMRH